ncbi:MAG TPA: ATP-binding protein [Candidatus Paceibacterota bacterium]|nr:ATP-binding protein [Candidatus Paceibacterota bacterium]
MKHFFSQLALPEMRIFWTLLPLIAIVVGIVAPRLEPVYIVAITGLLFIVAGAVFWSALRVAQVDLATRTERNELRNIVMTISDALIVYDQDFRIFFFNPAAEKLFALSATDVVGQIVTPQAAERPGWTLLAQVIYPSLAPTLVYKSKTGEYPQIVDISFPDPFIELRVTTANIVDEKEVIVGFMKVIRNRTQEISLLRSKTEFITVASHQLRTPITEVNWALDTLSQNPVLDEATKQMVVQTNASAKKIMSIVEDLLTVTKIEEGHFGYAFEQTDPVVFLDRILAGVMPQIQKAGLKLYFDRPAEPPPAVSIDPQKLTMAISNLLDNAARYNVPNGEIIVRMRSAQDPRFLEISIKDTGIGVPPEEIKKMFAKFFRASNAVKFQTEGSGLGLYIAKNIVQAHGGQMWAESEVNRGTTFFFTIPIDPTLVPTAEVALDVI